MIATWDVLQPGLKTLFKRLSSLPYASPPDVSQGVAVVLERQEALKIPSNVQQADIDFAVVSDVGYGDVEIRQHYDAAIPYPGDTYIDPAHPGTPLGTVIVEINENRQVTFQVTVSGVLNGKHPREIARTIRDRLPLPSALDDLRVLGLALADVGPVMGPIPELDPNFRAVPKYAFEFVCNYMSYAIDAPQTTIETSDIGATVLDT